MGTNTLANRATAQTVEAADVNQFVTALVGDLVPRSAGLGPVTGAGSIGSSTYKFLDGYLSGNVYLGSVSATTFSGLQIYKSTTTSTPQIMILDGAGDNSTSVYRIEFRHGYNTSTSGGIIESYKSGVYGGSTTTHNAGFKFYVSSQGTNTITLTLASDLSATFAGSVSISSTTASTSTTTGALVVAGGIGSGGRISSVNLTVASTSDVASFTASTAGRAVIVQYANADTNYNFNSNGMMSLKNTNNTDGNFACIDTFDSSNNVSSRIAFINTSHTTHESKIAFVTRGSAGGIVNPMILNGDASVYIGGDLYTTAWTTWTPTFSVSGGTAPSFSSNKSRYKKIGKTVIVELQLENSSGGTAGSGASAMTMNLPVAASSSYGNLVTGFYFICNNAVSPWTYTGYVNMQDSTTVNFAKQIGSVVTGADMNGVNLRYIVAHFIYQAA